MSEKPRRPWIAAALSVLVPGLGQLYSGAGQRALVVFLGYNGLLIGLLMFRVPRTFAGLIVFVVLLVLFWLWAIWDAVRVAYRRREFVLKTFNRWYIYLAAVILAGLLARLVLALSPIRAFWIPSGSMEPALLIGDHLYADLTYYRSRPPTRGELILFTSAEAPGIMRTSRVIGLGGEEIEIRANCVFVGGQALADPWAHFRGGALDSLVGPGDPRLLLRDNFGLLRIPEDAVFAMGDNRDNSYDSRFTGPVPLSSLRGRPLYIYWAPDKSRIGMSLK